MLHIESPLDRQNEREYVLSIILRDWLGVPYRLALSERADTCLTCSGQAGEILLPDTFFRQFARDPATWLTPDGLPSLPLTQWDTRALARDILLTERKVPVLFGESVPGYDASRAANAIETDQMARPVHRVELPLDIFGSAFFMLSRYEEAVLPDRDNHDRFPATASLAYRAGFLDRPIIDEYVEILWTAMKQLWPTLRRKPRQPRTLASCDVDSPFYFQRRLGLTIRRMGGDILRRHSLSKAWRNARGYWNACKGRHGQDPHRQGLAFIMDVNERAGCTVAFYFIPENTDCRLDNRVSLDDPRMRSLLREIHARGHEIGVHPGYHTYRHPEAMARSVTKLRQVLAEEGIEQPQLGGRQHFLRWETPTTARLWDDNGLDYDSTLSFADRPGFRCGTCREYAFYDVHQRRSLHLRERPLIVMECSVIAERYLGLGYSDEALALMNGYRDTCYRFSGDFTLLWHNSHLSTRDDQRFYASLIGSDKP